MFHTVHVLNGINIVFFSFNFVVAVLTTRFLGNAQLPPVREAINPVANRATCQRKRRKACSYNTQPSTQFTASHSNMNQRQTAFCLGVRIFFGVCVRACTITVVVAAAAASWYVY